MAAGDCRARIGAAAERRTNKSRPAEKPNPLIVVPPPEKTVATVAEAKPPADANLIDDDGHSMWTSPTSGKPLDWAYLPPGVQIVLALRPTALAAHPEGDKLLAALGPLGSAGIHSIEEQTGVPFRELERLVVGWQLTGDKGELAATLVAYARAVCRIRNRLKPNFPRRSSKITAATPIGKSAHGTLSAWLAGRTQLSSSRRPMRWKTSSIWAVGRRHYAVTLNG